MPNFLKTKIYELIGIKPFNRTRRRISFFLFLIYVVFAVHGCTHGRDKDHKPPIPVVVQQVKTANLPIYISALGTVTANYTVTVKTQVNGQLMKILFTEGQLVNAGDLLAQIDPRPYEALLTQYQGQLLRDTALLNNANIDLKRYQQLWREDSVAKQTADTQASLVKQYEGAVKIDQGLIQSTYVSLSYTNITSPISGRVGLRLVDPGNIVSTTDTTGIAVITMLTPIDVIFAIPEDNLPDVMKGDQPDKNLSVEAYDRQQNKLLDTGHLLTVDNQIDPTTGTVKLKAVFNNEKYQLFPNQFVNIRLLVTTLENVTVVPTAAIQHTSNSSFVYVLNPDQTVSMKTVETGETTDDTTLIKNGLTPGQSVVTDGADKLVDGSKVSVPGSKMAKSEKTGKRHFFS